MLRVHCISLFVLHKNFYKQKKKTLFRDSQKYVSSTKTLSPDDKLSKIIKVIFLFFFLLLFIFIHTHTHTDRYAHPHTHTHTNTHASHTHTHTHAYIYIYIYIYPWGRNKPLNNF